VTLRFGKYSGERLEDVPLSYLAWLFEEGRIDAALRRAIRAEIANRIGTTLDSWPQSRRPLPPSPEIAETVNDLIVAGYRQLALRRHPDRGGDHQLMIAATSARDWLLGQIGEA
jgi:hypothetical protein